MVCQNRSLIPLFGVFGQFFSSNAMLFNDFQPKAKQPPPAFEAGAICAKSFVSAPVKVILNVKAKKERVSPLFLFIRLLPLGLSYGQVQ